MSAHTARVYPRRSGALVARSVAGGAIDDVTVAVNFAAVNKFERIVRLLTADDVTIALLHTAVARGSEQLEYALRAAGRCRAGGSRSRLV
jgi:hypothetical protein